MPSMVVKVPPMLALYPWYRTKSYTNPHAEDLIRIYIYIDDVVSIPSGAGFVPSISANDILT